MLSPQQLGQLIPFIPALIYWLRHCDNKKAGDLFITSTADMDDVQATLRELLNAINYNGDLTNIQLRYICSCHDAATWTSAVRLVIAESDPRIIPNEVGAALTAAFTKVVDADLEQFCFTIGAILDQLPRSQYDALGEFCALLRDTSEDLSQISSLVGPMVLNPRTGVVPAATTQAAINLMLRLITDAESVFGKPGSFIAKDAFGIRKPAPLLTRKPSVVTNNFATSVANTRRPSALPSSNNSSSATSNANGTTDANQDSDASRQARRMQQLRAFYLWRDPSRAEKVPILFASHCFEDIAKAVMKKYGMLPPGWKSDLIDLKAQGSTKLDWFTGSEADKAKAAPAPAATQTSSSVPIIGGATPNRTTNVQAPPPPIQTSRPQSLRMFFTGKKEDSSTASASSTNTATATTNPPPLNETAGEETDTVAIEAEPEKPTRELTVVDRIVNEICDTEQSYHDSLAELIEAYVKTIRVISSGQKGPEAAEALGLTSAEVEQIFGWRLEEIINVSNNLLSKLEVVTLVRSDPLTGEGRQGLVAEAFIEISNELHVYAPYVSAHKSSIQTLEKAIKKINEKKTARTTGLGAQLLQRNRDKGVSEMTFTKLWEVVSSASPRLKGQSISSILIMPVQRVPRYKLLLRELSKETKSNHPAYPILEKANELINTVAIQINEALRQRKLLFVIYFSIYYFNNNNELDEKLGKFFGEAEMLNPTSSAVNTKGGKGYNIKQGYVDAI